jgi:hypothetical protein
MRAQGTPNPPLSLATGVLPPWFSHGYHIQPTSFLGPFGPYALERWMECKLVCHVTFDRLEILL